MNEKSILPIRESNNEHTSERDDIRRGFEGNPGVLF